MDAREQVGRPGQVLNGKVEEQPLTGCATVELAADFRVVPRTVGDRVVEDRRVRGQPGDRKLVDVALQRAAIEQVAGDIVEPQALAELVEQFGCV